MTAKSSARSSNRRQKVQGIMKMLRAVKPELAQRYHVKSIGIFGSYLRNEQKRNSDLDLLVEFATTPDIFQFMELEQYLADLLGVKVDLVSRAALRGRIGEHIESEVVQA